MHTTTDALGSCPNCDAAIPTTRVLIEYETTDGAAMFADCPDCRKVVHPMSAPHD